jgi:hypothetical protein
MWAKNIRQLIDRAATRSDFNHISAALRFIPHEEMKQAGYAKHLPLLEKSRSKSDK